MMTPEEISTSLLDLLKRKNYTPLTLPHLAASLGLDRKQLPALRKQLKKFLDTGVIAKVKGDRYCISAEIGLISGRLEFSRYGSAIIKPEGSPLIYRVRHEDTATAFDGDTVLARVLSTRKSGGRGDRANRYEDSGMIQYAKVIRILTRNRTKVVGTLRQSNHFWHVVADNPRFYYDVIVPEPAQSGLDPSPRVNDKVVVQLNEWEQRHINPSGVIIENLGKSHTPMAEYKGILAKFDLSETFPDNVLEEVKTMPREVTEKDIEGRLDLRNEFTLTIDPSDAKDFDDAISIRRAEGGGWEVGVHIADVPYYVRPGSAIDREAARRGNSTYLVGTVIPMLPFELSNGICSLVEDADRLVKSAFLTFDGGGDCKGVKFANCVIRSNKRLSYEQAYAFLKNDSLEEVKKIAPPPEYATGASGKPLAELDDKALQKLRTLLRQLWSIASVLRKRRMKKGSLDLETAEVKIYCDKQGYAQSIKRVESDESHQLIEEFMIAANEAIAREMFQNKIPYISRVHDDPDPEKLDELREYLLGFNIQCGDLTQRREVMRVLDAINRHPQNYILKTQFLKSLKRAVYRAAPDGHYGLNKIYYAHFTSPIRRYADFTVHRNFNFFMQLVKMPTAPKFKTALIPQKVLDGISESISRTERNSAEAERESQKIKLLEFFERKSNGSETFEGVITGVTDHGFFVELTDSYAFGFVHIHNLKDDIYKVSGNALVGRRFKKQYKIGQKLQVGVESVDKFKRQIDFNLDV